MVLEQIWQAFIKTGTLPSPEAADPALAHFYLAIFADSAGDHDAAYAFSRHASDLAPDQVLFREATRYLQRIRSTTKDDPYQQADSFGAFIRGGANVALYERLSSMLCGIYDEYNGLSLLEIGVGDGLALLPALNPQIVQLDLVEPSSAMLAQTRATLDARGIAYRAFNQTIQVFAAANEAQLYDIAQATFSLQSIVAGDRAGVLRWLRSRCARLIVAEFDVPAFSNPLHPERVRYMVERYEQGLAEYADDNGLVAQGFLMPMFFGAFNADRPASNYEQPATAWRIDLHNAGFRHIEEQPIYDYWWAPAVLIDAR
jgi:hypothetical protein